VKVVLEERKISDGQEKEKQEHPDKLQQEFLTTIGNGLNYQTANFGE